MPPVDVSTLAHHLSETLAPNCPNQLGVLFYFIAYLIPLMLPNSWGCLSSLGL